MLARICAALFDPERAGSPQSLPEFATCRTAQPGIEVARYGETRHRKVALDRKSGQREAGAKILVGGDRRAFEQLGVDRLQYFRRCFAVDHAEIRDRVADASDAEPQPAQHTFEPAVLKSRIDVILCDKIRRDCDPPAIALDNEISQFKAFDAGILERLVVSVTLYRVGQKIFRRRGAILNSQQLQCRVSGGDGMRFNAPASTLTELDCAASNMHTGSTHVGKRFNRPHHAFLKLDLREIARTRRGQHVNYIVQVFRELLDVIDLLMLFSRQVPLLLAKYR